jgi:LemA protein
MQALTVSTRFGNKVIAPLQLGLDVGPRVDYELVKFHQAVFDAVAAARSTALATNGENPKTQEQPERNLIGRLRGLLAVAENYPDLKASEHFLDLQKQLVNTEDRIQLARRIYNANVRDNNILIESVPSKWVAASGNFKTADFFEIDPVEAETPPVDLG